MNRRNFIEIIGFSGTAASIGFSYPYNSNISVVEKNNTDDIVSDVVVAGGDRKSVV